MKSLSLLFLAAPLLTIFRNLVIWCPLLKPLSSLTTQSPATSNTALAAADEEAKGSGLSEDFCSSVSAGCHRSISSTILTSPLSFHT